jgi:hypothetical protein
LPLVPAWACLPIPINRPYFVEQVNGAYFTGKVKIIEVLPDTPSICPPVKENESPECEIDNALNRGTTIIMQIIISYNGPKEGTMSARDGVSCPAMHLEKGKEYEVILVGENEDSLKILSQSGMRPANDWPLIRNGLPIEEGQDRR